MGDKAYNFFQGALLVLFNITCLLSYVSDTNIDTVYNLLCVAAVVIIIAHRFSVFYDKIRVVFIVEAAILLFCIVFIPINIRLYTSLSMLAYFFIFRSMHIKKILMINIFCFVCMAAFIQMGISMGIIASDYYFYKGDKPLFLFGFNNPNRLGYALFQINIYIFLYLSLAGRRIAALLLFLAGSIVFYNISLSRTGIVASFAVVLFSLLLYSKFAKRIVRYLLKFFPLAAFVTTYYLSINYAKYPLLNMITSRRLELYHRYISGFKISNFFAGYMYHYTLPMDSGYLYMLFTSGAIGLLYYFTLFWKAVTQKTLNAVYAIIIAVSLYALMESIFPNNSVFCVFYYILLYKASRNEIKEFRSKSWMAVQIT